MNHPAKNKHKNPLLPEDDQIEERNLIDLKDSAEISLEDRISIYWMENKGFLTGCIIVMLVVVAGYQSMRIFKEHSEQNLQTKYAEANANETLADFAKANDNKELGGFAALSIADNAYNAKDYTKALEFYSLAARAIKNPTLAGRAQLGEAFALYQNGNTNEGLAKLNAITADNSLSQGIRAEAAYHLAIEADAAGRKAEFENFAAQVNESLIANQWQQRLSGYQQQTK